MATSDSPLSVPNVTLAVARGASSSGGFTPLVKQDFDGQTVGGANADYFRGEYSNVVAKSGSISTLMTTNPGQPPATCGGGHSFGGRQTLPITIPVGKTIWQRYFFYLPSSFSLGYIFGTSDGTEASTCGKNADGSGYIKWLVFAPDVSTSRSYLLPEAPRRQFQQAANDGIGVLAESDSGLSKATDKNLPRDQWFSLQLAVKVSKDTNDGFLRAWMDDQLVVERTGINTVETSDTGINEFGIGNYWNGVPYTDGTAGRDAFYIDEVMVATDVDGYGSPTGTDANGNAYIAPTTLVSGV